MALFEQLGANLDWDNSKIYFPHPCDNTIKIYVLLDPVHMLKLVRNHFESLGEFYCENGEKIKWNDIIQLHKLQSQHSLRLGNKLTNAHVYFKNQKMKVI